MQVAGFVFAFVYVLRDMMLILSYGGSDTRLAIENPGGRRRYAC